MVQIKLEPANFKNLPIFKSGSAAQLHQVVQKPLLPSKKVKMWSCEQCNIYFPIPQMLELHNKSTHQQPSPIAPNKICQGYFRDAEGVFRCQYCSFSSRIRSSTRSHALRRHGSLIKIQAVGKGKAKTPDKAVVQRAIVIENEAETANNDDDENSWEVETLDENLPVLAELKEKKAKDPLKAAVARKCPFCPFTTDNPSTHRSHVKRSHYEDWLKLHGKGSTAEERQKAAKKSPPKKRPPKEKSTEDKATEAPAKKVDKKIRSCPHCAFETMTKSTLYSHINRTHRGRHQSKKRSRDIGDISGRRHNNAYAHTGYACSHCTFAGARVSSLRCHVAREHGEHGLAIIELPVSEFDCEQCDFKCKSRKAMQHHTKTQHRMLANEEGLFSCHMCSYESTSRMGVQRHISVKHDRQRREARAGLEAASFKCEDCDYQTLNAKILEWHRKQHEADAHAEDDGNAYYCNDCDFSTWTKSQLYTHIRRNHRDEEPAAAQAKRTGEDEPTADNKFTCELCDYTTKNKHVLKVHVIRKHTEGFNHACELCGKKYKVKADLTNHMRFQHREQPIICDVCGKTCRNSNLLYLHQKFAHYKPEFECHICHRRMVTQANLDEHILKQHEQRQDVVCEECGKTFTRQTRLKIHMRTHLGLRPYICHICGKAFARKNGLRQHLLIHTGQRPYICDICGKDFTQKTGLISHRKSHPGSHPPLPRVYIDHVLSSLNQDKS